MLLSFEAINQLVYRDAHLFGVISGEDISEIACRHTEIHRRSEADFTARDKVAICRDIVHDLRYKPPQFMELMTSSSRSLQAQQ